MRSLLENFWLNLSLLVFFSAATFAFFFISLSPKNAFFPKNWPLFWPSGLFFVVFSLFSVFRISRVLGYFKKKKWLQTALVFIQILWLFGLLKVNLWLFLIKLFGISSNPSR
jgi:hypothetical protein